MAAAVTGAAPSTAPAEVATTAEMERVCRNWLALMVEQQGEWAGSAQPTIRDVREIVVDGRILGRNYAISPVGHIVVPVLKDLPPIKVYSEVSDLDPSETGGPALLIREMLQNSARLFIERYGSLEAVQPAEGERLLDRAHRDQWDRLLTEPDRFRIDLRDDPPKGREGVGPLLTTYWHQGAPYNNDCPDGDGGKCVVGCVATAAAQLMRYHQWPPRGVGEFSYGWDGDQSCGGNVGGTWLWADFRDEYDWANMPNGCGSCTPTQEAALAELCYEVGVAFEMDYGACGSGAYTSNAVELMPAYFRYAPGIDEEPRSGHSAASWFSIVQEEINLGRPMLYSFRYDPSAGHAIVCDGWRIVDEQNQYHMNYGWGGGYNAWYAIDNIYHTQNPMEEVMIRRIAPGTGTVFQVRPDGLGYYPTIQAAIDDVLEGDVIELTDGVFTGEGNRDLDFRGKPLTLRSASGDPETCIIDCGGDPEEHRALSFASGEGASTIVSRITIQGGYVAGSNRGGAVYCGAGSSPTISECVIRDCSASAGGGAVYCDGASPTLSGVTFLRDATDGTGGAILACNGAAPRIVNCTLYANEAPGGGGGVFVCVGANAFVENTIVAAGTAGGAIGCDDSGATAALLCCDLYGNAGGDYAGCVAGQLGQDGNISEDPLFCDAAAEDFHLGVGSPCDPDLNPSCGLIGALPPGCGSILVRPDGTGDFPTIQAGIDAALDGFVIELADGVFTGTGNREIDFRGKAVTLQSQSGDPLLCAIDCQGGPSQPHRAFLFHSAETAEAVVRGITIRNGYQQSYSGGAIWFRDGASPTIEDCVFERNQTQASGGAIYASSQAAPKFVRCTFHHNATSGNGGVIFAYGAWPQFDHCTLAHNSAGGEGGAIAMNTSSILLDNTIIAFGLDGGSVACFSGDIALQCCDIYGNAEGDWSGCISGQMGVSGNISEDPQFCYPDAGNYRLMPESPCAPDNPYNPDCGLIGSCPADCDLGAADELAEHAVLFLAPPSPNPSQGGTAVAFSIPSGPARVRLAILDASGRRIRTLLDADRAAGDHTLVWDGRNDGGSEVAGGIYFARIEVEGARQARRVVILR